jgi:hypothetical protein
MELAHKDSNFHDSLNTRKEHAKEFLELGPFISSPFHNPY